MGHPGTSLAGLWTAFRIGQQHRRLCIFRRRQAWPSGPITLDDDSGYSCDTCGTYHAGLPLSYAMPLPDAVLRVPEAERDARCLITEEGCIIDEKWFYLRGNLDTPVNGYDSFLSWSVWVACYSADFRRYVGTWDKP